MFYYDFHFVGRDVYITCLAPSTGLVHQCLHGVLAEWALKTNTQDDPVIMDAVLLLGGCYSCSNHFIPLMPCCQCHHVSL